MTAAGLTLAAAGPVQDFQKQQMGDCHLRADAQPDAPVAQEAAATAKLAKKVARIGRKAKGDVG